MNPTTFSCIICGFPIYYFTRSGHDPWLREFRAISSSPTGTFVSGVGCHDNHVRNVWIAPSDPTMRWDDDEYLSPASDEIPVMSEHPVDGRHGFVLHDACWQLLQRAFKFQLQPGGISLQRLLEVCESLPYPRRGDTLCWGHDYGRLVCLDLQDHYPWEEWLVEHGYSAKVDLFAKTNPFHVQEIPELLATRLEHPPGWFPTIQEHDCFSKLPWEILEAIAIELQTNNALDLRHVSKSFLPLLSSGIFWASRFEASSERGFLFEKWESLDTTGLMSLYRLTTHGRQSLALQNRRRIWNLTWPLSDVVGLRLAECVTKASTDKELANLRWSRVSGDIKDEASDGHHPIGFSEGCRLFGTHVGHLPPDISTMSCSMSSVGNDTYVAGIQFTTSSGPDICLGFISDGHKVIRDVTTLSGFVVVTGSRGIHALQVVSRDGSRSEWVGCPNHLPITQRLANFSSITALEVGFDGYKMVCLAVLGTTSPSVHARQNQGASLREAALWYPTIPEPKLYLNEEFFTGEHPSSTGYHPFFWVHFGGPGGSYLDHVTGVSVYYCFEKLYSLEFHYDAAHASARPNKLGRRDDAGLSQLKFPIDGAGGERIEIVEVSLGRSTVENAYSFLKHGILNSLKITTNRKRSFYAGLWPDESTWRSVAIAPGTTLTGLYASQHQEFGLISLGAISEAIGR